VNKSGLNIRHIVAGAFVVVVVYFAYGPPFLNKALYALAGDNFFRTVRGIMRVWLIAVMAGFLIGVAIAKLLSPLPLFARGVARFLRIVRWTPFLLWFVLAVSIAGSPRGYWIFLYGALAVALTPCYKLLALSPLNLSTSERLRSVFNASLFQGMLIAVYLIMVAAVDLWMGAYPGAIFIGHKVFFVLACVILLLNWLSRETFESAAADHGKVLLAELKNENWQSLATAFGIIVAFFSLWQLLEMLGDHDGVLYTSPANIAAAFLKMMPDNQLGNDFYVSVSEMAMGIAASGVIAVILISVIDRIGGAKRILDVMIQATQIAPLALLPDLMLLRVGGFEYWSAICVAVFVFYPIVTVFYGLRAEPFLVRMTLAVDAALPYAAAGIVYGEAMQATAGLGFVMVVAGATRELDKGMVAFFVLISLVALLSALLRRFAKAGFFAPTSEAEPLPPPASAAA
jgi:ABC-type nitrate/sulfonate/bicarbonate transport system permease component